SPHEIPVAKALIQCAGEVSAATQSAIRNPPSEISFDPFSYQRRATDRIVVPGVADGVAIGGEELLRVLVRKASFEKIAHKIDRMGDYKPEVVYENAAVLEVDPSDESEVAALNQAPARLVTVRDGVGLPIIAAFRL